MAVGCGCGAKGEDSEDVRLIFPEVSCQPNEISNDDTCLDAATSETSARYFLDIDKFDIEANISALRHALSRIPDLNEVLLQVLLRMDEEVLDAVLAKIIRHRPRIAHRFINADENSEIDDTKRRQRIGTDASALLQGCQTPHSSPQNSEFKIETSKLHFVVMCSV